MLKRRQLFQLAGVAAWMYSGAGHSQEVAAVPFRHYPLDPVDTAHFRQKLFVPGNSGPFGVLDVAGPLKIRATAANFPILPGPKTPISSPFLL
jgi:suppressor of ftsI/bilirubin oxidase